MSTLERNKCIIAIYNDSVYDSSVFICNENTYYAKITYQNLENLFEILKEKNDTNNMVFLSIITAMSDESVDIFFDFKCSSCCNHGEIMVNEKIQEMVYDFVKWITEKRVYIIVSDHSMSAFFRKWSEEKMGTISPIYVMNDDIQGRFKMKAVKEDFLHSVHPILQKIANLSENTDIDMEFCNMPGTKKYDIHRNSTLPIKIMSRGFSINDKNHSSLPVHCEIDYGKGKIIVSSTHWCNLENVESEINMDKLRDDYTQTFGFEACSALENEIKSAGKNINKVKRIVSDSVKELCSGTPKKIE